ncbi:MAG TPA: class I SAM-dependent methyltransferase [Ktedonobacteraceae bacterium]|jgi:SAM-dependent methyltransferase|nr:class I SAM-dependent methyltransferase [Ktedonobacteraceae bacterium]
MATPDNSSEGGNVYFNDPESGAEMARLLAQDRLVTRGMGGLFSERSDLSGIHRILDAACGPGGWALEVAFAYPDIEVVGFDVSRAMIDYARAQARVQGLNNASFHVMDIQKPLDFADESFDLVNSRFINFLPTTAWPRVMQEFGRITRPGGTIRLTESEWWYFTNSPALEELNSMVIRALKLQGASFTESGRFTGVLPMLGKFLLDAGCSSVNYRAHVIDYSYGTEAYDGFRRDAAVVFKLFQGFIVRMGVATQETLDQLYDRMQFEMLKEDFRGLMLPITAWGEKG